MFSGIDKNFFIKLGKDSELTTDKDRSRFWPIFDIVLKNIKDKNIYLDSPRYGETAIKWSTMDLFSTKPESDALDLLKCICDSGYDVVLNTNMPNYSYNFVYDTRNIISLLKVHVDAPCKVVEGIKLYPFILHQIDMFYKLIDLKFFSDWLQILENCFENDKNIANMTLEQGKEPSKDAKTVRKLLEKYGRENCYFFVDPENLVTIKDIASTHEELRLFFDKFMHVEIVYKKIPICISTRRIEKYAFYLANTREFVFSIFTLGTYTLFPYCPGSNEVDPIVSCFISLINVWISYSIGAPALKADFERYKKNIAKIIISKKKYAGTYIDENIERKMKLLQLNVANRTRGCSSVNSD